MDGTLLDKKYNIVGRIKALEAGSEIPDNVIVEDKVAYQFSTSTGYLVGSFVYKDHTLYRFDVDHDAGPWNPEEVTAVRICDSIISEFGDGLQRSGNEVFVKLQSGGGLAFDTNGDLYSNVSSMVDQNVYNFNPNTPVQIGKVIKGQNEYPLYRVFVEPAYALFTPEAQETTVNFIAANITTYPLDERAINIKFFANGLDVTNTFEFGRIGLNGSSYLQAFSCHMANRVQITHIMIEYYEVPTTVTKKKTSK